MSDELDPDEGRTAVAGRPQRPTGKRSRQRDGGTAVVELDTDEMLTEQFEVVEEGKKGKKVVKGSTKDPGSTRNPFTFVWNYLKQVVAEMRKVIWPNRKQMISYTTVVLAFLVFMVALIGGVDLGWHKLVLLVFG